MPRERPGALRAEQRSPRAWVSPLPARIGGLTARTVFAIQRIEVLAGDYLFPGATDRALRRYREFLEPPGRKPLYPQDAECSCRGCSFDDVRHARDVLEAVLLKLPSRARTELARLVAPLDTLYLKRTLADPFAHRQWRSDLWWRRRLAGGRMQPV